MVAARPDPSMARPPSRLTGVLLGIGLGGFVDGIALHQILQWHHLVSDVADHPVTTVAGLEANTLADGLFHVLAWVVVLVGSLRAVSEWRQGRRAPSWAFHLGTVLMGWGLFNVVEGLVDHQLLGIHHVRDDLGGPLSWDVGFLVVSVVLVAVGWVLHRAPALRAGTPAP
jgi:uncharacterized membrane protein